MVQSHLALLVTALVLIVPPALAGAPSGHILSPLPPPKHSPPPPPLHSPPPPHYSPPPPPKHSPPPPPPPKHSPPPPPKNSPPPPPPPKHSPPPPPKHSPPPPPPPKHSPPPPPKHSPPPPPTKPKIVKCSFGNDVNPYCRGVQAYCPAKCPQSCTMDCKSTCKPVCVCDKPGACGDPRFIGGDGNSFYFHGQKDRDFCIVSDSNLHINAHFIGKRSPTMTRDFTWIQAVAVLFGEHSLYVGARKTATWNDENDHFEISFDGEHVHLPEADGAEWKSLYMPALKISRTKAVNTVMVQLKGRFKIIANVVPITKEDSRIHNYGLTSEDCMAHLDLAFKFDVLTSNVHGVVGQTYRPDYVNKFDVRAKMPVLGGARNFSTSNLLAADCAVARFGRGDGDMELISNLADVKCASGMDGPGVICKK
ncbi:hypothetical protein LUZ62_032704 [Rhynchospora pubera]|uniref:Root cap n=1 Tax=Rhynchospora pubera TaxID=906938 RepID=A0AAV8HQH7_9POAL|nr:hypothetical protein LUZ62_032704 [Rhynchospora pubera]